MEYAARAAPDGYTIFLANNGTNAILRSRRRADGADLQHSFTPVIKLVSLSIVIVATPSLHVSTLAELMERARSVPDTLAFATGDLGSTSHLAASLLFQRAHVKLIQVPYAGTALAVKDVLAGEVPVLFTHLGTVASNLRAGRLRALAVTGSHRMSAFPEIPTVAESGFPGFDVITWHGVLVPTGTPRETALRLHDELEKIMLLPEVRDQVVQLGMEPETSTPEQFAAELDNDVERWAEVMRDAEPLVQ
jgi:tripartite-type tricarboxylate transporter receptor subunit TctC